jgi:hypothetical protein
MSEGIVIDTNTAVIVCAGPSLDRLSATAWNELRKAGAIVAVNGAFISQACSENNVMFSHVAAMTSGQHMEEIVPGFLKRWKTTRAWRLTREIDRGLVEAESYVRKVLDWSEDPDGGFFGGSSAMSSANWLHNDWLNAEEKRRELEMISLRSGKPIPRRGYRKFVFIGLDMIRGQAGHAIGAGVHASGFATDPDREIKVRRNWGRFYKAATCRGSHVLNLSPDTGLTEMPSCAPPMEWVLPPGTASSLLGQRAVFPVQCTSKGEASDQKS